MGVFRSALALLLALVVITIAAAQAHVQEDQPLSDTEPDVPECPRHFTREMRPVCASNGRVFNNPSIFRYHQCVAEKLYRIKLTLQDMALCGQRHDQL